MNFLLLCKSLQRLSIKEYGWYAVFNGTEMTFNIKNVVLHVDVCQVYDLLCALTLFIHPANSSFTCLMLLCGNKLRMNSRLMLISCLIYLIACWFFDALQVQLLGLTSFTINNTVNFAVFHNVYIFTCLYSREIIMSFLFVYTMLRKMFNIAWSFTSNRRHSFNIVYNGFVRNLRCCCN